MIVSCLQNQSVMSKYLTFSSSKRPRHDSNLPQKRRCLCELAYLFSHICNRQHGLLLSHVLRLPDKAFSSSSDGSEKTAKGIYDSLLLPSAIERGSLFFSMCNWQSLAVYLLGDLLLLHLGIQAGRCPFASTTEFGTQLPDVMQRDYNPWTPGPYQIKLGLQPIDPSTWFEVGHDYDAYLDERERLLRDHHGLCVVSKPEVRPWQMADTTGSAQTYRGPQLQLSPALAVSHSLGSNCLLLSHAWPSMLLHLLHW